MQDGDAILHFHYREQGILNSSNPTCYIIAGPNGAGKTTFANAYIGSYIGGMGFLNVDNIAKEMNPDGVDNSANFEAGRVFIEQLDNMIEEEKDFAFETTLSGRFYIPKIRNWRSIGWSVVLYYLYLPSPAVSVSRVKARVEAGGHDIPMEAILRRYPRSLANLFLYANVCDMTLCFDNSGREPIPIFEKIDGEDFNVLNEELFVKLRQMPQ